MLLQQILQVLKEKLGANQPTDGSNDETESDATGTENDAEQTGGVE